MNDKPAPCNVEWQAAKASAGFGAQRSRQQERVKTRWKHVRTFFSLKRSCMAKVAKKYYTPRKQTCPPLYISKNSPVVLQALCFSGWHVSFSGDLPGLAEISHEWLEAWQLGGLWTAIAPQAFPKSGQKTTPLIDGDEELGNKGRNICLPPFGRNQRQRKKSTSFFFWLEICWLMRYLEAPANLVSASPAVGSNSRVNHGGVQVINHRKR